MNLLQIPSPADSLQTIYNTMQQTAAAEEMASQMNAFDLALKGGWIMIVLLVLLLMTIYVLIERTLVINKAGREDNSFYEPYQGLRIHDGKIDAALNLCHNTDTPSARMVEKGISRLGRPMGDVMSAIENQGNIEISKLEKRDPGAGHLRLALPPWWVSSEQ